MVTLFLPETANVSLEDMRSNLNYRIGGGGDTDAGTFKQFVHRNMKQTSDILRCRKINPKEGMRYVSGATPVTKEMPI